MSWKERKERRETLAKIEHNRYMLDTLLDKKPKWNDWKEHFTLIPKRCKFTGEIIVGRICRRTRVKYHPWADENGRYVEAQYASMKEVFRRYLDGTLQKRV